MCRKCCSVDVRIYNACAFLIVAEFRPGVCHMILMYAFIVLLLSLFKIYFYCQADVDVDVDNVQLRELININRV